MMMMMMKPRLKLVNCCALCKHHVGWMDNMFCMFHDVGVEPFLICKQYDRDDGFVARVQERTNWQMDDADASAAQ